MSLPSRQTEGSNFHKITLRAQSLTNGSMTATAHPTHYEILDIPCLQDEPVLTAQTLRPAYRKALLRWHPDKANALNGGVNTPTLNEDTRYGNKAKIQGEGFSIDQISTAYFVLSNLKEKRAYDEELKKERLLNGVGEGRESKGFNTGVEVVDLDDLEFDEGQDVWYRGCRCGEERGFEVREEDLEEGESDGEVLAGCRGCSLWLRVLFGVVEDASVDQEDAEKT